MFTCSPLQASWTHCLHLHIPRLEPVSFPKKALSHPLPSLMLSPPCPVSSVLLLQVQGLTHLPRTLSHAYISIP